MKILSILLFGSGNQLVGARRCQKENTNIDDLFGPKMKVSEPKTSLVNTQVEVGLSENLNC
ncbi:hypothetical protein HanRHA438_Chr02g0084271 [Helianthus annuus]|nr:hypothetical protein HanIR_Chr02g0085261 [Helianthus annuus]KAJ0940514.1 hypothetical protein HanRHA438_Chr02g0084271 [Helianthus annuus]